MKTTTTTTETSALWEAIRPTFKDLPSEYKIFDCSDDEIENNFEAKNVNGFEVFCSKIDVRVYA